MGDLPPFCEVVNVELILQNAVSVTLLLGFVWGIFSYSILKPLNTSIKNLNDAIKVLRMELLTADNRRHELEIRVAELDQRTRSDHSRLERLEVRFDEMEHR